ncbi:sugar ABC transporter ATP-binding protein [Actinomadura graeca]|uniref:Sugar ABC transporter ATP-binding protein n=2 Tax=Actinomadura graeca TaxID=2750812 RepID=A0ABX8R6M1_9ACTN|nr:sugar ABC transporter ATP-binding protein [Actinomadura graeca]
MRFGNTTVLHEVTFDVRAGEVVCLLGDNGAGKSTLIKVLSGVYRPTSGSVEIDGTPVRFAGPAEARARGIATVHQYGGTAPLMSIDRNFFLGAEPVKGIWPFRRIDRDRTAAESLKALRELGLSRVTDARQLAGTMSGGERQALAIARAVYFGARLLILDEPTSALGVKEAALVLRMIGTARANGVGVVFITHNAQHAMAIGDRFAVLISGAVAAAFRRGEKSRTEVLDLMAGGEEFQALTEGMEDAHGPG